MELDENLDARLLNLGLEKLRATAMGLETKMDKILRGEKSSQSQSSVDGPEGGGGPVDGRLALRSSGQASPPTNVGAGAFLRSEQLVAQPPGGRGGRLPPPSTTPVGDLARALLAMRADILRSVEDSMARLEQKIDQRLQDQGVALVSTPLGLPSSTYPPPERPGMGFRLCGAQRTEKIVNIA